MGKRLHSVLAVLMTICMLMTMLPLGVAAATDDTTVKVVEADVLVHGRTYEKDDILYLDWTNSGITFNFTGTGAKMTISNSSLSPNPGYVNVYVDGALVPSKVIELTSISAEYVLAEGLTDGAHTISVRKRNEAVYGGSATVGFVDLTITGGALTAAPAMSDRRIEVIGDSITAGFGNLDVGSKLGYSSHTSDGTATYATLTAAAFGADIDVIARSGIRFVRADESNSMYPVYDKVSGLGNKCIDPYDFENNEKDVVVINLGTNDSGAQLNGASVTDDYIQSEAKAFLELVRSKNPNAEIIWAYGIMNANRSEAIKAAISELNAAGDSKISYFALDAIDREKEGYGTGNHPSVLTAINRSMDLAAYIAQKTGWTYRYDAQLAWQLRVAEDFTEEYLLDYSAASAAVLTDAIANAKALNSSASNAVIKAAIDDVQTAHQQLQLSMAEVAILSTEEVSRNSHYMEFSYNTDVDFAAFSGRQLYVTFDLRADLDVTPANDIWRQYVKNGAVFVTDNSSSRTTIASGLSLGGSSLEHVGSEWCTVAAPISTEAIAAITPAKLSIYYYNDTGNMSDTDKAGVAWSNDAGVTLRVKNVRLMVVSPRMQEEGLVYSVNAVDYGADATGITDSTAAIQNAINSVRNDGGIVYLPQGRYRVNTGLSIPGGVTLRGDWTNPDEGGLGQGTILMAYAGKNSFDAADPASGAFITLRSGGCLKNISVWYPEQDASDPSAYPVTVWAEGHTDVINVTLYNSYYGFYNNSCSSMLIRGLYGTALYRGIHGAYAYDIPRIEQVKFDTAYWADSGLPNAPSGSALTALNAYAENNLIAIQAGEQDWGYWYDLSVTHAKYAVLLTAVPDNDKTKLVPGNIAAGKLTARHVQVGVYMENVGYPGFQLTDSDIRATQYGMYYAAKPDYSAYEGWNVSYYDNATIAVTTTNFSGGSYAFYSDKVGNYGVNFNDCTFADWSNYAISLADGSLVCSNSQFLKNAAPIQLKTDVSEAIFIGNTFAYSDKEWSNDSRVIRDDANTSIPHTPAFSYDYTVGGGVGSQRVFNVKDYGAVSGTYSSVPSVDSTDAFQAALDAAKAAGGGIVYVPGGVYRMNGGVTVPTGVELRGTFESAHYGNSTNNGAHLYVYGGKGDAEGTPLVTLEEGSGVKGFSVFYPEQGYTDTSAVPGEAVYAYPPTVRANADCWIQNMSMVCTYTAIDAMTNRCDNIIITDVTGAAMYATLIMGHGTRGGYVQNLHFNYSGWTHQGIYTNKPTGDAEALFNNYTTGNVYGLILGDCQDVQFLSCFNILVADQIVLKKDPYTGGSFKGTMWGVAFDAAGNGIVAESGCDAELNIIASMGVFNQQGGGYNVVTQPGFTGRVGLYNADAWSSNSRLAYVEGGTVDLVQYFSWCAYKGYCGAGGTLNLYGSTMVDNNSNDNGYIPHIVYAEDASGEVVGNLSCRQQLNVNVRPNADVYTAGNGTMVSVPADTALVFSDAADTYTATNGIALDTGWVTYDNGNTTGGINVSNRQAALALQLTLTLTKQNTSASDAAAFGNGWISLRSADADGQELTCYWSVADLGLTSGKNTLYLYLSDAAHASINWEKVNRLRVYIDSVSAQSGSFTMKISEAKVVDTTLVNQHKQALKQLLDADFNWDSDRYTEAQKTAYKMLYDRATAMYADITASANSVLAVTQELQEMQGVLLSSIDKSALQDAVRTETRDPLTPALYTVPTASAYSKALANARALLANNEAEQADVDNALVELQAAKAALRVIDKHTVFTISSDWDVTNGTVQDNVTQFYHNWRGLDGDAVDLTQYDTDNLVLRMNLRLGLSADATVSELPSTLTVSSMRLAIRSNNASSEETSLYDTSILSGLHWGDNLIEIPFSVLKAKDSGVTDWQRINDLFLGYEIAELADGVVGDYLAEIDNVCLVNKAVETTMGNVSVVGNGRIDIAGGYLYGADNQLTASTTADADGVRFVGWHANNRFVRPAEDTLIQMVATGNEEVTAYFLQENEKAVVFYGKYDRVIGVQVVTNISQLTIPKIPELEGYVFCGWDEPEENWPMLMETAQDGVVGLSAVYETDSEAEGHNVTVIGGHRTNGSATSDLPFDTRIVVQADVPEGKILSHWELDGMNVGTGNTYTFYVSGHNVIKAVYVDQGESVTPPTLSAAIKQVYIKSTGQSTYTITFVSQTYMPKGYTLLEYGAVIAPDQATLQAIQNHTDVDKGLAEGHQYLRVVSSSRTPNRQYLIDLYNVKEGRTRYAMAYIIARDASGQIHTIYSPISQASTIVAGDGIGSGDDAIDTLG